MARPAVIRWSVVRAVCVIAAVAFMRRLYRSRPVATSSASEQRLERAATKGHRQDDDQRDEQPTGAIEVEFAHPRVYLFEGKAYPSGTRARLHRPTLSREEQGRMVGIAGARFAINLRPRWVYVWRFGYTDDEMWSLGAVERWIRIESKCICGPSPVRRTESSADETPDEIRTERDVGTESAGEDGSGGGVEGLPVTVGEAVGSFESAEVGGVDSKRGPKTLSLIENRHWDELRELREEELPSWATASSAS